MSWGLFCSLAEHHVMNRYLSSRVVESDRILSDLYVEDTRTFHDNAKVVIAPPEGRIRNSFFAGRPRLTSKIHVTPASFAALRNQGLSSSLEPSERILYNLLHQQYPGIGLLIGQSDEEAVNNLTEALSEAFTRYEGKCSYKDVKILANFELQNEKLQEPYWQMLCGKTESDESWRSFLSLISFNQCKTGVSLWLAPEPVLCAIFDAKHEEIQSFVQKRRALFNKMRRAQKDDVDSKNDVESEFRSMCEKLLPSWLSANSVDMTVSMTPPKK